MNPDNTALDPETLIRQQADAQVARGAVPRPTLLGLGPFATSVPDGHRWGGTRSRTVCGVNRERHTAIQAERLAGQALAADKAANFMRACQMISAKIPR